MAIHVSKEIVDKDQVGAMIEWLASFGKTANGGVTRLLYSKAWQEAQKALKGIMDDIGLDTYFDSAGNLFGRLQGSEPNGKTVMTGSHVDTVVEGGKYDGGYGIIASFLAVLRLFRTYGPPRKTIELVSLCEEEGSRFPLTFWGSRNISGAYDLNRVKDVKDSNGVSFLEAMNQAGFDPNHYISPAREDVERFLEIHIEQGIILEKNQKQVGIVTHIVGQRRYTVQIKGESNHAGTTPMQFRKDAVSTASHLISFLTKRAKEMDPRLVATVGSVNVKPNVANVIAGEIEFSLDIRHHQEQVMEQYCSDIFAEFKRVAEGLDMGIVISQWMDVKPIEMDKEMCEYARVIASEKKLSHQDIVSGAGHDSQVFGTMCPTSLLFVPSQNGISHSPKEFTKLEDLEAGIELLTEVLYRLAY
ncbi:allantoate deiminase [Neobacillus sp. Marseille-QA0830]